MTLQELKVQAVQTRKALLSMIYHAKTGHTGGALSSADIMTALFFHVLKLDPSNPFWEERDYFILSKGHCVEGYLAVLAERGFFPPEELETFSRFKSRLIGHPNNKIPGIEMNTGALGHGLSISVGMAIGLKKDRKTNRVFTLMGDGEQAEGSVWEAAMAAGHYKLDNLVAIIDRNHLQISGSTEDVMSLEPLAARWESFGWEVKEIDGNAMDEVVQALTSTPLKPEKPTLIIAHTIKGKGVKAMENVASWHHGVPNKGLYEEAMAAFTRLEEELRNAKL
ncbi:transketolase [Sphaerochaeta associata]|uniref:Transketolase n=1 Tax=Sphaerochaeta associata TaxID=1129264 RepID=A0ABY4DBT6_9SPIR|nr:transketolase [Sphaerochaeta associata]UOM51739.1 transketolase [Sphaerochaeta associata]SMP52050.1 transketolase [Sphaerochaeta associata]